MIETRNVKKLKPIKTRNGVQLYVDPKPTKNKLNRIYDKWGNSVSVCDLNFALRLGIYQEV